MKKLTIECIAPFLPYGLQCNGVFFKNEILQGLCEFDNTCFFHNDEIDLSEWVYLDSIKPLLLPLNELTVDDWTNVFNAGLDNAFPSLPNFSGGRRLNFEFHDKAIEAIIFDNEFSHNLVYAWEEKAFSIDIRFNQLSAFECLFKLHADMFGLIEKGLAIDKTTIK